jgi:hypothetical protein
MQMLNLGLSIFNKIQTMQHRQIKIAQSLRHDRANKPLDMEDLLSPASKQKPIQFIKNQEI